MVIMLSALHQDGVINCLRATIFRKNVSRHVKCSHFLFLVTVTSFALKMPFYMLCH